MPLTGMQSGLRRMVTEPRARDGPEGSPDQRPKSEHRRLAAAWLVLIVGALLSVTVALAWRVQAQDQVRRSFDAEAAAVETTVTTSLLRMDDLTVQARALISSDPNLTNRGLTDWYASLGGDERYRGILSFGYVEFVPAAGLQAFKANQSLDPIPGSANPPPPFAFGSGPSSRVYCLARLGLAGELNRFVTDPSFDYCSIPGFNGLPDARDSGQFVAFTLGDRNIAVFAPVYRGGIVPPTLAQRQARAIGVVAELFDIKRILGQAIAGHGDLQIAVIRPGTETSTTGPVTGVAQEVAARVGATGAATSGSLADGWLRKRFTVMADGRWIISVSKASVGQLVTPTEQGVIILVGGLILSVLAALLVRTLSTGRARALRTVEERTEQLRHMALHDALTGLPNRQLMSEQAEKLLERGRRENLRIAAMYMDIDGFKGVNDSFGHPAGDELLRASAARIVATL
ncbi:MAG TPA: diguanylate cyclase, partial [Solirubrobacteraceae bacterium]